MELYPESQTTSDLIDTSAMKVRIRCSQDTPTFICKISPNKSQWLMHVTKASNKNLKVLLPERAIQRELTYNRMLHTLYCVVISRLIMY